MTGACRGIDRDICGGFLTSLQRRIGSTLVIAVILCGSTVVRAQSGGRIAGPSGGQVAGAAIGVGAAVAIVTFVALNHGNHSLTGCVFEDANGMKLRASDSKVYTLRGGSAAIKPGNKVKLHGSRVKKLKGVDSDQTFDVEKVSKDYGPCQTEVAQASSGSARK